MDDLDRLQIKIDNYIESCEQSRKIEKRLINILKFLFVLAICLIFGHYFNKCSKTEQKPIIKVNYVRDSIKITDTIINNIVQERIKIKTKLDTLNKIIYVPREVIIKDTVLCDSLYSLAIVQKKMISNDSILITKLNVNIKNYKQLDTLQSKTIDSLQRLPKGRLKWFMYGVGSGFVIGSIGSLIK
jgi:hypothetical protein